MSVEASGENGTRTDRLLLDVVERLMVRINDLALDLVRPSGVVPQAGGAARDVALCERDGLAVVQGLDGGELEQVALEQVRELEHHAPAVPRADLAPGSLEGGA